MADGAGQMTLAETHAAVDEERIIGIARLVGGRDRRRMSKLVAGAHYKFTKRIAQVEVRTGLARFCRERNVCHGIPLSFIDRAPCALIDITVHRLINSCS